MNNVDDMHPQSTQTASGQEFPPTPQAPFVISRTAGDEAGGATGAAGGRPGGQPGGESRRTVRAIDDPFLWLEGVEDASALAWVEKQNAHADGILKTARFAEIEREVHEILANPDKIAAVRQRGAYLYNFWTDAERPRGVWRRTTWESYQGDETEWEELIDVDQLGKDEGISWVWGGASVLPSDYSRALITLSRGGSDAYTVREFDMDAKRFISDGFCDSREVKGGIAWARPDGSAVLISREDNPENLTASGYPATVRLWERGQALADAPIVYRCPPEHVSAYGFSDLTQGYEITAMGSMPDFFSSRDAIFKGILPDSALADAAGADDDSNPLGLREIPIPDSAESMIWRAWALIQLRDPWEVAGEEYPAGALLVAPLDDVLAGDASYQVLYRPNGRGAIAGLTSTRDHLVLTTLEDVTSHLYVLREKDGVWDSRPLDLSHLDQAPSAIATLGVQGIDPRGDYDETANALWLTFQSFTEPASFARLDLDEAGSAVGLKILRRQPRAFAAEGISVSQHFARSDDGTAIPYFEVRASDEPAPTLLNAYGGFEVSRLPAYLGAAGKVWLERGGTWVLANIRGGGEYGPAWHQAALRENRPRAYEDLAAVARDLVARGVCSAEQLGVQGGSNGGLLVGNMFTRYPELFGAVVCQVPLLDMRRYSRLLAGASWVAEYGDPDKAEEWEFIQGFSPYHRFHPDQDTPPILFTTSTRDDRVHPGHARKMMALMAANGKDVTYWENTEGGHGGAADLNQRARMAAYIWEFLLQRLAD